ncbi:hypothetical protein DOS81_02580, partial [Staphylococcus felis]|uniref:hypothetical protein n=1 Tax=Staphylococcus felis TaxID=46127 RepID=UPI000E39BAAB
MVEGQPIKAIPVTTTDDSGEKPTVKVKEIPQRLTYNTETGVIEGTPEVPDWRDDLPNKDFEAETYKTVTLPTTDVVVLSMIAVSKNKEQRDKDKDCTPDLIDTDDDGEGVPDQHELDKVKTPKDGTEPNHTPQLSQTLRDLMHD